MNKDQYFGTQMWVAEITNLTLMLPLRELTEEMAAAKLIAAVSDPEIFAREQKLLKMYQDLTSALAVFQEEAKGIMKRNGVGIE